MGVVYILSDCGKLGKKDETLSFMQNDGTNTILFPFKTEHLVLMGNISISGDALRLLSKYKIPTSLLSSNGRFNGKLIFGDSKNVFLRQKQYRILDNRKQSLEIARSIVTGKIRNQISFMQRIKRKTGDTDSLIENSIIKIKQSLQNAENTGDIEKLRGYEGIAARLYFSVFGLNITPDWAEFKKRSKNPPRSNVNAVLSFLYSLLMSRVESAIESEGLDTCVGNLHALNYGRTALVFDLMEEFRSAIADSVCCALFNLGTLKEEDFEIKDFSLENTDFPIDEKSETENGEQERDETSIENKGVLLTKPGLKKVIASFEEKMDSLILYQPTNQKISYTKIIYEQASHYKRVISGDETSYKAYSFK